MIIKDSDDNNSLLSRILKRVKLNKKHVQFLLLVLYSFAIFTAGMFYHFTTLPQEKKPHQLDLEIAAQSNQYNPKISQPEKLEIGISQKDFEKLLKKRNEALRDGVLVSSKDDYIPAKIRNGDHVYRTKIRLKGDWVQHLEGPKWSFRVSVKGEETIFGMREFSIQHPKERNFISEWVYHNAMRREGVIGLDFKYVEVIFNGDNLGIYALEEHFDKRLVENNKYREGPIIKFDEDLLWADRHRKFEDPNHPSAFFSSAIDVFQAKKVKSSEKLQVMYDKAYNLLERFRRQELQARDVFDVDLMARYYALSEVLGGQHMAVYHNMRFYYNPVTSKLEPIAFDAMAGTPVVQLLIARAANNPSTYHAFDKYLFSDPKFVRAYMKHLNRMADQRYIQTLLAELSDGLKKNINILNKEFSNLSINNFFNQMMIQNFKYINMALNPIKTVHAYFKEYDGKHLTLRVSNIQTLPVEIQSIERNGAVLFKPVEETVINGKIITEAAQYIDVKFKPVSQINWTNDIVANLKLKTNVLERQQEKFVSIFSDYSYDDGFLTYDFIRQKPNHSQFSFLEVDEDKKTIRFKAGSWDLTSDMILPEGYKVTAPPGLTLNLSNGAKILSYSSFHFVGHSDNKIIIESRDRTGQGIVLLKASERSLLQNVVFRNLSAPKKEGWELTGAVTFYESPVSILNCTFLDNHDSDDSLNVIRSEFDIKHSQFANTFADAIDIDFSKGFMSNLDFRNPGNDALDFSGSSVSVSNVTIDGAADKGLSVGEDSNVYAGNIMVKNSKMAFVSKDSSLLKLDNVSLNNCYIGLIAYQKKPEFGPAEIEANRVNRENVKKPFLTQGGSKLSVDGQIIQRNDQL